jgi:hypothetical protein
VDTHAACVALCSHVDERRQLWEFVRQARLDRLVIAPIMRA